MNSNQKPKSNTTQPADQTTFELMPSVSQIEKLVPASVIELGEDATKSFLSFFIDNIRNKNTRSAYHTACKSFFCWTEHRKLSFAEIESFHVSAYIEALGSRVAVSTVKQHLAALRMLFDWLVIRQVTPGNPCHAVRGPKLKVTVGKTPILDETDAKKLLASIPTDSVVGLRDRALIALMTYTFARISAALSMTVDDYYPNGRRMWIRLKEKRGLQHQMPAHHKLEEYMDAYIAAANIGDEKKSPLFRAAASRNGSLKQTQWHRRNALAAIQRRAKQAGINTSICCHTFRGTGITNYLTNSGSLAEAQKMAGHADCRTTKLYDRRNEDVSLDEVERISI